MNKTYRYNRLARRLSMMWVLLLLLVSSCADSSDVSTTGQPAAATTEHSEAAAEADGKEAMPILVPIPLATGETLQVAATTSIIGDIVAQIGGDQITLFTLMGPGADPHSYTPTPQDLRTLGNVDLIFINGLHLEEGLADLLNDAGAPQVSVNATVELLANNEGEDTGAADADDHAHGPNDPHTWQSVTNVKAWVATIEEALSVLDPANADAYHAAATSYRQQLDRLDTELRAQIATIPAAKRKLVTDHESFNYFARDYGFTIVGALIPSLSSLAASGAQDLAALQDQITAEEIPVIFVGTTVNPNLANQIANDLQIAVVPLYSDALSASDGPATTYLDFMRYNVTAIVTALQPN